MKIGGKAEKAIKVTLDGMIVNVVLLAVKLAAGIFGHSQAMVADALHTLSDFASDIAVVVGIKLAQKPRDADHAYGHGKYEVLAAAVVGIILLWIGLQIGKNAVHTLFDAAKGAELPPPSPVAFWAALVSILFKEALFWRTLRVGRATRNDSVIANAWHHRSDAMSSVATAMGVGAAVFLGDEWALMDPVAAIMVCFLLLKVAVGIIKEQVGSLTERSLSSATHYEIIKIAEKFTSLRGFHNLRTRAVGRTVVIDLHVMTDPDMRVADAHEIVSALEEELRERFGRDTIANIHIEPLAEGSGKIESHSG